MNRGAPETSTVAGLPVHQWAGDGGPTVIGLPGLGSSGRSWAALAAALPSAHVVAPDLRGRGLAYQASGPTGLRTHARDVAAIADELDLHDVVLVGHSMGAYLAPVASQEMGGRVSRLVLLDGGVRPAFPFFMTAPVIRFVFRTQMRRLERTYADADAFWKKANRDKALVNRPDLVDDVYAMVTADLVGEPGHVRAALDTKRLVADALDSFTGHDTEHAIERLTEPALLLAATRGKNDKAKAFLNDAVLADAQDRQPLLTVQRVEANHLTLLFAPEVIAAVSG